MRLMYNKIRVVHCAARSEYTPDWFRLPARMTPPPTRAGGQVRRSRPWLRAPSRHWLDEQYAPATNRCVPCAYLPSHRRQRMSAQKPFARAPEPLPYLCVADDPQDTPIWVLHPRLLLAVVRTLDRHWAFDVRREHNKRRPIEPATPGMSPKRSLF